MRLRQRDLRTVTVKKFLPLQDSDGTAYSGYEETGAEIKASIQPAGGKLMAEMYGQKLAYMKTMRCEGTIDIVEGDGVCVDVPATEEPDYRIIAVSPWDVKVFDLEKVK